MHLRLPLREQFEILYVKCALKPVIQRIEYFDQLKKEVVQEQDPSRDEKKDGPKLQLSDDEEKTTEEVKEKGKGEQQDAKFSARMTNSRRSPWTA